MIIMIMHTNHIENSGLIYKGTHSYACTSMKETDNPNISTSLCFVLVHSAYYIHYNKNFMCDREREEGGVRKREKP